jgi:hypothetical protein
MLIPFYSFTPGGLEDLPNGQFLGDLGEACFDFSPDGRLLKARACGGTGAEVVYDLHERTVVKVARRLTQHPSVFVNR